MSLAVVDPGELDQYADPGEFVILACERAKQWLTEAVAHGDIDGLVDLKSKAEAIRVYTVQKQLGHDAELAAQEIVRRAERGLGVAIRRGQDEGEFCRPGERQDHFHKRVLAEVVTPQEWLGNEAGIKHLTDGVSDEQFEDALTKAKAEGNLSRANVVRKARGDAPKVPVAQRISELRELAGRGLNSSQIAAQMGGSAGNVRNLARDHGITITADKVLGNSRRLDSNRIVQGTVDGLDGVHLMHDLIDFAALDGDRLSGWVVSLSDAIRSLTTLKRNIEKEMTSRGQR